MQGTYCCVMSGGWKEIPSEDPNSVIRETDRQVSGEATKADLDEKTN